ncbi:FAD-binding protein [Tahibacter amnicola]|uniref:FAD-binding oxidoreductase n=1 Tax=Tahibacter amnicola TaxID=2976241 RepID=A0ABY6BE12_9GAMM|nr:FAD-binding oxidoreductase [Tahibacter amnicola]UXI66565.1 FAD-binding oxidoreductase [Tahibacter amnicola]
MNARSEGLLVNDRHSALNASCPAWVECPAGPVALRRSLARFRRSGMTVSVAGGRHAMGGQQFCDGGGLLDMTRHARVLDHDSQRGLIEVEAGIRWPALHQWLTMRRRGDGQGWCIRQKQSGADDFTLGGSLSANAHGRGLDFAPLVQDIEAFRLILPDGTSVDVDRSRYPGLFAAAIGGYGLLGVVDTVTLRLARRCKLERRVRLLDVDLVPAAFEAEVASGSLYGDFQFSIDPSDETFLRHGVFACYRPLPDEALMPEPAVALNDALWRELMRLAHVDKREAFRRYCAFYERTDGQRYASDDHQFGIYPDGYHAELDRALGHCGSEMITELYVPAPALPLFLSRAADVLRPGRADVIYGTVRRIRADRETLLAWAREDFLCVVFNLHVRHDPAGIAVARDVFRSLIDEALDLGGSYYLTYHGYASATQVRRAYPQMERFLALKREIDPRRQFCSDWFRRLSATRVETGEP